MTSVQVIAKFNVIGETEELGSAPYVSAIGSEGLAPGQTGKQIVMKTNLGYTSEAPRAVMFTHSHVPGREGGAVREVQGAAVPEAGRVQDRAAVAHQIRQPPATSSAPFTIGTNITGATLRARVRPFASFSITRSSCE